MSADSIPTRPPCIVIATSWVEHGISYQFRALAQRLAARGFRVILLLDKQRQDLLDPEANPGVLTWPSYRPTGHADRRFLNQLLRQERPACVIANFSSVKLVIPLAAAAGIPVRVAWYHALSEGPKPQQPAGCAQMPGSSSSHADTGTAGPVHGGVLDWLRHRSRRRLYQQATQVVAVSEAARVDLMTHFDVPGRKAVTFHNCLADPISQGFADLAAPRDITPSIVCIGELSYTKGQDLLVAALARLLPRFPALQVTFIMGESSLPEALMRQVCETGAFAHCRFLRHQSRRQVFSELARAWVAAVPSRSEAFGLVTIEAMAVETPVVAARVGGIPEVIRDGTDGFLVPSEDAAALADKLVTLLSDAELRTRMGRQGRQHFLENFEFEKCLSAQVAWLETLVRG